VIGTSGDVFTSLRGTLQWNLGEVMVETFHGPNGFFTQGFEQSYPPSEATKNMSIYPNPVSDFLILKTSERGDYSIECYTIHGQKIADKIIQADQGLQTHQIIDLVNFGQALYILKIRNLTNGKQLTVKIAKL
jgi:hypothetical protein